MPSQFNSSDHAKTRISQRGEKRHGGLQNLGELPAWLEKDAPLVMTALGQ